MVSEITSLKNPLIREIRRIREKPADLFLVEGRKMTAEAVACGAAETVLWTPEGRDRSGLRPGDSTQTILVDTKVMQAVSSLKTPQGIVCVCRKDHPYPRPAYPFLSVALNGVQDPGNVGTILRTLDAAGGGTAYLDRECADPYGAKALSASMGSIFRVRVSVADDLPDALRSLKAQGVSTLAGDLGGEEFFGHPMLGSRVCVVIGNEGHGISDTVRGCVDHRYRLPIPGGAESLNAAVSAGIFLYDLIRDILH